MRESNDLDPVRVYVEPPGGLAGRGGGGGGIRLVRKHMYVLVTGRVCRSTCR